MSGAVNWRGITVDERTAQMLDEVDRLTSTPLDPVQGSYSGGVDQSAGTHSGGGAVDLGAASLTSSQRTELETNMRKVGFAAWVRSPSQGDWNWHCHGIAVGCSDLSGAARDQVDDYVAGRNGLANNGPDTGNRSYVGVTWETYQGGKESGSAGAEAVGMIVGQHKKTGEIFVWNGTSKLELPVGGGTKSGDAHSAGNTGHVYVDEVLRMIKDAFPGTNPKFVALNPDIMDRTPHV